MACPARGGDRDSSIRSRLSRRLRRAVPPVTRHPCPDQATKKQVVRKALQGRVPPETRNLDFDIYNPTQVRVENPKWFVPPARAATLPAVRAMSATASYVVADVISAKPCGMRGSTAVAAVLNTLPVACPFSSAGRPVLPLPPESGGTVPHPLPSPEPPDAESPPLAAVLACTLCTLCP
jgi:hypothetical protein